MPKVPALLPSESIIIRNGRKGIVLSSSGMFIPVVLTASDDDPEGMVSSFYDVADLPPGWRVLDVQDVSREPAARLATKAAQNTARSCSETSKKSGTSASSFKSKLSKLTKGSRQNSAKSIPSSKHSTTNGDCGTHGGKSATSVSGSVAGSVASKAASSAANAMLNAGTKLVGKLTGKKETVAHHGSLVGGPHNPTESFARRKRQLVPSVLRTLDADRLGKATKQKHLTVATLAETIRAAIMYAFFLTTFSIVAFSTRSSSDFWANHAMKQLFVDGTFFFGSVTHEKTLHDVHFAPQFFQWLEGPFLEKISVPEIGSPERFVAGYNRIIGPVRLRQLRVQAGSCSIPSMFDGTIDTCYAPYTAAKHETAPFGPPESPLQWRYTSTDELDGMTATGMFATYSGGGYVVDLPLNATLAQQVVADLRHDGWVDRATRAVFVDMSCFNANTRSLISMRLLFEFLPTGGIMPHPTLRVLRPLLYEGTSDYVRALFEAFFVAYVLYYVVQEARELRRARKDRRLAKYWQDQWNILDWAVAGLAVGMILMRVYVFSHTLRIFEQVRGMASEDEYINLQPLMWQLQQLLNINALTALLLFLKFFKFLAVVPQMDLLFATIRTAGLELLLFSILFSIVILGFAMAFYMAFGLDVHGYRSISNALLSLFQMVLGIFDYDELWESNRILAPLLFTMFVILVVLILMNIFLAILNDAFAAVSERQKRAQNLGGIFKALFFKKVLRRQMDEMLADIDKAATLHNNEALMDKIDYNGDGFLDAGELEQLLRQTKLYEHFSVKELMQRFDTDGDGKLSGNEIAEMNDALLRKRRHVDMQLAAQLSPRTRAKVASIFGQHENNDGDGGSGGGEDGGENVHMGSLSTSELRDAIEEMGYEVSDGQLDSLMKEFDADNSSALDLLEFTALMARMLGYRELPSEQHKLLRKVFAYVDTDNDGHISPDELRAIVSRFGLRMPASQLDMFVAEFDADNDGKINVTEFVNIMSKLHGRLGITTNPALVAKDLQITVRKLEQLVQTNMTRTTQSIEALVAEAKLNTPTETANALANKIIRTAPGANAATAAANAATAAAKAAAALRAPAVCGSAAAATIAAQKVSAPAVMVPNDDDGAAAAAIVDDGGLGSCIVAANASAKAATPTKGRHRHGGGGRSKKSPGSKSKPGRLLRGGGDGDVSGRSGGGGRSGRSEGADDEADDEVISLGVFPPVVPSAVLALGDKRQPVADVSKGCGPVRGRSPGRSPGRISTGRRGSGRGGAGSSSPTGHRSPSGGGNAKGRSVRSARTQSPASPSMLIC